MAEKRQKKGDRNKKKSNNKQHFNIKKTISSQSPHKPKHNNSIANKSLKPIQIK